MSAMQTSLWCSVLCVSKHKGKWQMVVVMHTHTHKECTHMTTATTTVDSTTMRAQTSFLKDSILFIYGAHTRNILNINICWLVRCEMPYDKNALVFIYIPTYFLFWNPHPISSSLNARRQNYKNRSKSLTSDTNICIVCDDDERAAI